MGHPIVTTLTLAAAVTNGIAQSQSLPGASGLKLALNGSLVTNGAAALDAPRRIIITSAGNDSGITWTVVGTRGSWWASTPLTETFTGANIGAAQSTQDFLTVTSITGSGATASTVTAGTDGVGSGPWVPWSKYSTDFQVSLFGVVLSGSPTWQVDYTYDDVFGLWLPPGILFPRPLTFALMTGVTGTLDGALANAGVRASRLTISALGGGIAGSAQLTQEQQGVV